jgi:hypothetical protein
MPQKYAFVYEGKQIGVGDLPVGDIGAIAKEYDVPWYQLVDAPLRDDVRAAMALAEVAAKMLGVTLPEQVSVMQVAKWFQMVDDDMPTMYEDGRPLEDGPATT